MAGFHTASGIAAYCKRGNLQYAVEWIDSEHTETAAYFDYERLFSTCPFLGDECVASNIYLTDLCQVLQKIIGVAPRSICESCGEIRNKDNTTSFKLSYHIVFPVKCSRVDIKKIVHMATTDPAGTGLDNKPYNRRQAWRLAGMVKKDDENRRKNIVLGTFEDSLIANVDNLSSFVPPSPSSIIRPVEPCVAANVPSNLLWVHHVLQDARLRTLWQNKSDDYNTWLQFIFAVLAECSREAHYQFAKNLVIQFSSLSSKFDAAEVEKQFEKCQAERITSKGIKSLKRWITNSGKYKAALDDSLHLLESSNIVTIDDDLLDLLDNISLPSAFVPVTSMHWLLVELANSNELSTVLEEVRNNRHPKGIGALELYSLVRFLTPEEDAATQRLIAGLQKAFTLANLKEEKYLPYDITLQELQTNEHHRKCLSFLLDQLVIAETDDLQVKLSAADKMPCDKDLVSAFFHVLSKHANWLAMYKRERDNALYPLANEEYVDVFSRILHIRNTSANYILQLPYKKPIMDVWQQCDNYDTVFRLAMVYSCPEIFRFEQYLPLISSVYNDVTASKAILSVFPYVYSSGGTCFCYCPETGRWMDTSDNDGGAIKRICMRLANLLQHHAKDKQRYNFATSAGGISAISKTIGHLRGSHSDNDGTNGNTSRGKLLFPNGIYDGKTQTFHYTWSIHLPTYNTEPISLFVWPECYFYASIPDPYVSKQEVDRNEAARAYYEEVADVLFTSMNGEEVGKFLREELGKTLLRIEDFKGFWIVIGNPNSGKSTLKNMIEVSVGDYAGTASLSELELIKGDRRDVGLRNQFAYNNWYRSFLFFSEISEGVLNTELIKSHSSGMSDRIPTRTQYKPRILVDPQYVMWIMCNDVPTVSKPDDPAYIDRAKYMRYDKVYKPLAEITDPTSELPAVPEVKQWKNDKMRRQLFVRILIDAFEDYVERGKSLPVPESVKQATKDSSAVSMDTDGVLDQLMYSFLLTGDDRDMVTEDSFRQVCEDNKIKPETAKKCLTIALDNIYKSNGGKIMGRPVGIERITRKGQKINVWRGMTMRNEFDLSELHAFTSFAQWKAVFQKFNGRIPKTIVEQMDLIGKSLFSGREYELDDQDIDLILPFATPLQRQRIDALLENRNGEAEKKRARIV